MLTHFPLHSVWPDAHAIPQDPAVQVGVPLGAVHWLPHDPQLSASVFVSTHSPLHSVKPLWQVTEHAPPEHAGSAFGPPEHTVPHCPQLIGSELVSVQSPPHSCSGAAHELVHTLWSQVCEPTQGELHAPQWLGLEASSTHCPAQFVAPEGHAARQPPPAHTWPVGQAWSQPPQCEGCVAVSTHAVPHTV